MRLSTLVSRERGLDEREFYCQYTRRANLLPSFYKGTYTDHPIRLVFDLCYP